MIHSFINEGYPSLRNFNLLWGNLTWTLILTMHCISHSEPKNFYLSSPTPDFKTKKHEVVENTMDHPRSINSDRKLILSHLNVCSREKKSFWLSQSFNCHAHPIHSWVVNFSSCIKFLPIIIFMLAADDQHDERSKEIGPKLFWWWKRLWKVEEEEEISSLKLLVRKFPRLQN